jgi:hypothetical protein
VSETAKRPIEELLADWGELRWEAGENPHFDTERIYVIGDELSARLAQREAQIAQARALVSKWCDAAVWEHDDMGNTQSAQTFDQCADELSALLDPS